MDLSCTVWKTITKNFAEHTVADPFTHTVNGEGALAVTSMFKDIPREVSIIYSFRPTGSLQTEEVELPCDGI